VKDKKLLLRRTPDRSDRNN